MSSRRIRHNVFAIVAGAVALVSVATWLGACRGGAGAGPNVLLIVIDTLRADHLGVYGYERSVTPEIDAWAAGSAIFEQALATSPWTLPSFGSLFTGQLVSRHTAGVVVPPQGGKLTFVKLDGSVRTLAEILKDQGYATVAIVNNPFLNPTFELTRGFDTYDYVPGDNARIRRANMIVNRAFAWLDQEGRRPFFMVAHFFDPHMNYDPPPAVRGRFKDGYEGPLELPIHDLDGIRSGRVPLSELDRAFIVGAYDEEVLYVDVQVGRLLEGIRLRGLDEDTLIVLVADHGEEHWDHGGFEHGHTMFQELLHVPMIVSGPGVQPRRIAGPVSLVDVVPTVLEVLDLPPDESLPGRSLWGALVRDEFVVPRPLLAEGNLYGPERKALVSWPNKVVVNLATRQRQLYNLETDPGETENLAGTEVALTNQLISELQGVLRTANRDLVRTQEAQLDEATKEKLRALGYLE